MYSTAFFNFAVLRFDLSLKVVVASIFTFSNSLFDEKHEMAILYIAISSLLGQ